jgi:CTP synthase
MDETVHEQERGLLGWEQYLLPPVGNGLIMGDVIRLSSGSRDDPSCYYVILSPSCDIQPGREKVSTVVAARCSDSNEYVTKGIQAKNTDQVRRRLPSSLNDAHANGFAILPALPGGFPCLSVNMRNLTMIALNDIAQEGDQTKGYVRVVSIDSPFREQLAWAYLEIACRPGLPNRDHDTTVASMVASYKTRGSEG